MRSISTILLLVLTAGLVNSSSAVNRPPAGGGSTRAGFDGEYFANPGFSGSPAFTRRDVRINFDWKEGVAGRGLPVGGATTPGMADFPHDGFSIRWTGAVVARFSEPYTFYVTGKDGVRFTLGGKVLVDSLDEGVVKEVTVPLTAGEKVDLVFEYVDRADTGASEAKLEWSSPGTPREVVEPLSFAQICLHQASRVWKALEMANMVRMPCSFWKGSDGKTELPEEALDENGWPRVSDCLISLSHYGFSTYHGKYMIIFTGQANVAVEGGMPGSWNTAPDGSGEKIDGTLPRGKGYDPKTNTTRVWFDATASDHLVLAFTDAERAPGEPGLTGLQVWCPVANGAQEYHQPGEIYLREAREDFKDFVVLRQHIGTSQNPGRTWEQRTLPSYFRRDHRNGWGYCLEELIMAANDMGKDLHLCAGADWDEDFMRKLAQLVRYGSDGVNPYDRYVENPEYPPLNPNLRIYLEHSNELPWAVYPTFIWKSMEEKAKANHPDWQIVNYDGTCNGGRGDSTGMYRYHALRMKQLSDAFRTVYADVPGAIGDRARVLCFGQYASTTMNTMLQFLDDYFNKADPASTYEGEPHPPSYYLWGGGGAIYYGCFNPFGLMDTEPIPDPGFETPDIPAGAAVLNPKSAGWTFDGSAGICDVKLPVQPAVIDQKLPAEPAKTDNKAQWVGFKFTVGDKDLYVYQMGAWVSQESRATKSYAICDAAGTFVAQNASSFSLQGAEAGDYAYTWCSVSASSSKKALPVVLKAGETYYLVSQEGGRNADPYYGPAEVTASPGLTVQAAVTAPAARYGRGVKGWQETAGSLSWGPVNMLFTTTPIMAGEETMGLVPDESTFEIRTPWHKVPKWFDFGTQCAFIKGTGSVSREFEVGKEGAYWVNVNLSRDILAPSYNRSPLHILVDGQDLSPEGLPKSGHTFQPGAFHYHSSHVVRLKPGRHTLTLEMDDPEFGTLFIDAIRLGSEDAFYGGPDAPNFPAGGNAIGQVNKEGSLNPYFINAKAECEMAYNWGLVPMTYEGGWSVQADFDKFGMNAWNDLRYGSPACNPELTRQALRNAFDIWCDRGGYIYAYYYSISPKIGNRDAPLVKAVQEFNDRPVHEPRTENLIPGELTFANEHYEYAPLAEQRYQAYRGFNGYMKDPLTPTVPERGWKSWIVTATESADCQIALKGTGGPAQLIVDDKVLDEGSASGGLGGRIRLTAGVHSIRIKSLGGPVTVDRITVEGSARTLQH